uniref:Uncharacterized protein n=1 Tax=Marseillevirus LCMAC201 TaxID=2506605 RepID=A0A481YVJ7_9VIRU|nr:MAG: uncharacterized protein LCMAC201_01100 [Marseillevirus LCMAC201]
MAYQNVINKVLGQLRDQVLNLLDDLLSICPNEPDVLLARLFFENQVNPETLMLGFVKWVYPWKGYIKEHNEMYFEENEHIFGPLPVDKVQYFKDKIKDGTFDDDDKEIIWQYFEVFISLIEQYNKTK